MTSGALRFKLLLAAVLAMSRIQQGFGTNILEVLQSQPELSQAAEYFQDMEAFQVVSAAGGTVFAPSNSAFDAFVEKWKSPSLDISKFSDLPQQTQEQILEYHLAPTAWKPKLLCYQQIAAIGQDDQNITMVWDNRYLPMGPDNTVGSFQYDIDDMTFTVSDDYTGYKADFFAQSMLSSGSTVAYPIESILIPNVALQTLEGGGAGTDASDELDVVAEGPAQYQPQILEIL